MENVEYLLVDMLKEKKVKVTLNELQGKKSINGILLEKEIEMTLEEVFKILELLESKNMDKINH